MLMGPAPLPDLLPPTSTQPNGYVARPGWHDSPFEFTSQFHPQLFSAGRATCPVLRE